MFKSAICDSIIWKPPIEVTSDGVTCVICCMDHVLFHGGNYGEARLQILDSHNAFRVSHYA
jgi:hypothetical protein